MAENEGKDYWTQMNLKNPKSEKQNNVDTRVQSSSTENPAGSESDKRFEAYKRAHDIRKFEIERFWQRSTYYWAFILAAFTAHFALLGLLFSTFSDSENLKFTLQKLYSMPGLSLFGLVVTAFFCFLFSYCWVLMNKGSMFWQKNWEEQINMLENEFSGDLYKTFLNTNFNNKFSSNPLNLKAYDYSVSKITLLTSITLMITSFVMFAFYVVLFLLRFISQIRGCGFECIFDSFLGKWIVGVAAIIVTIIIFMHVIIHKKLYGNVDEQKQANASKWTKRERKPCDKPLNTSEQQ